MKKKLLLGIGTLHSTDDSVGLKLVRAVALSSSYSHWKKILARDADAFTLAYLILEEDSDIVVVDCANMGMNPGEFCFFSPDEAILSSCTSGASCHGFSITDGILLARELGWNKKIMIFGVEPANLLPGTSLSSELRKRFKNLLMELKGKLNEF